MAEVNSVVLATTMAPATTPELELEELEEVEPEVDVLELLDEELELLDDELELLDELPFLDDEPLLHPANITTHNIAHQNPAFDMGFTYCVFLRAEV